MTAVIDDYQSLLRRHADAVRKADLKAAELEVTRKALYAKHGCKSDDELKAVHAEIEAERAAALAKYLKTKEQFELKLAAALSETDV